MSARSGIIFVLGLVTGILVLGGVRFVWASEDPHDVHYHANWAVFLEGDRVDFTPDRYMEDVAACRADGHRIPARARVHLHNNDMDVVHVHHSGVTWGHFLANLGWGLGADWLVTDDGRRFVDGEGGRLRFVVNGFVLSRIDDRVIDPGDRVLIHWGEEDEETILEEYFPRVASNAGDYDVLDDPGGCGANVATSTRDRLRRAFLY